MRLFRGRFTSLWFLLELTNCGFHIGKVFKQMVYKIRGKHALKKSQCLQDQIFNRQTRRVLLGTLGGVCRQVLQILTLFQTNDVISTPVVSGI